jgi:hypothetical protein
MYGDSVYTTDAIYFTPLLMIHTASVYFNAKENRLGRLHRLLGSHSGINKDYVFCGETALLAASRLGHAAVVRLLLAYGANPNIRRGASLFYSGETPLHTAMEKGQEDIARALVSHGAESLKVGVIGMRKKTVLPCGVPARPPVMADYKLLVGLDALLPASTSSSAECLICYDSFSECTPGYRLACGHGSFHAACIQKWEDEVGRLSCPLCRRGLKKELFC